MEERRDKMCRGRHNLPIIFPAPLTSAAASVTLVPFSPRVSGQRLSVHLLLENVTPLTTLLPPFNFYLHLTRNCTL